MKNIIIMNNRIFKKSATPIGFMFHCFIQLQTIPGFVNDFRYGIKLLYDTVNIF